MINFIEICKSGRIERKAVSYSKDPENISDFEEINEEAEKPEDILRRAGFKIKLVTPTSFGTQIDFAKEYEEKLIKDVLPDLTLKFKNKSVFIIV